MSEVVPSFVGLSGQRLLVSITFAATMGFLLFGYDQGVMSGIIDAKPFNDVFTATRDNSTMQGVVTAIYELGCLGGALFILACGDWLGRRWSIMLGATVMLIGVIMQVTSFPKHLPLAQFCIGRVVTGIGNGMNTSTIPTYQAECSRTSNRGLLICIEGSTVAIGTLISYWVNFGCMYGPPDLTWRFPIAFQCVFGLIIIGTMWFLPESPRWLFTQERYEEGEEVIAALQGKPVNHHDVQLQKNIIMDSLRASGMMGGGSTPLSAVFTGGKTQHCRRMLLGASSQFFQQIGGCNAVIYYLPVLFKKSLGQTEFLSMILGGVNMIVYSIFACSSWFLISYVGRRRLFLVGAAVQSLSMVLTFACLIPGGTEPAKGAAVGLFTFIAAFGATWLPLPWLYPAEISPIKTRAKANAISTCTNWTFNFLIVMVTPIMIRDISWGTYLFFGAINASFVPFIYFLYPETAGRSLEEIDLIFAKGYLEKMSYVRAAKELPQLSDEDIERVALEFGFGGSGSETTAKAGGDSSTESNGGSGEAEKV
ncbi:general substrate transporter [Aspergillus campestris IBT 28561]|uniref:General substrate transporter n=1 Tax=Aspergillus campestris (strain IBT 28561) TaxID=1392248 RepID=A0A2I1D7D0_ASPC2|nr:general substrate transporter [Aspergillus campestris IBT 28561]PKY05769.1 general substrate transporter [Aspergillus campestris IBT 28561]